MIAAIGARSIREALCLTSSTKTVAKRHPRAAPIIPPRSTSVSSKVAAARRDAHRHTIARHGRISWQRLSGTFAAEPRGNRHA